MVTNLAPTPLSANDLAVIEWRICQSIRKAGRIVTDEEVQARKQAEIERLLANQQRQASETSNAAKQGTAERVRQLELIDTGRQAIESRADGLKVLNKCSIKAAIVDELHKAARWGRTRYELAQAIGCQQGSVCSTVLELIDTGDVIELDERRRSPVGGSGCVLILREFRGGSSHG